MGDLVRQLRLVCPDPKVDIKVDMGDGAATPTAGAAGWETVGRTGGRRSITARSSPPPFQQDVPIVLDGFREQRSVQRQLDQILSLGGEDAEPFRAYGPIHRDGRLFVFGGEPDYDEQIRDDDGGNVLIRVRLTLKLMEYVRPDRVRERKRRQRKRRRGNGPIGPGIAVGGTYTTSKGDTLQTIAADLLLDYKRWKEIGNKNGLTDPNRKLPAGMVLKI